MIIFLILSVALLLLPDLYIWFAFVRGAVPLFWSIVWWLPSLVALGVMFVSAAGHFTDAMMKLFFVLLLCVALPKLLFVLVSLVGRAVALLSPVAATVGNVVGLTVAAVWVVAAIYGFAFGWKRLTVNSVEVCSPRLPASFDGYRIVQLSDLHVGTFGSNRKFLERLVARVDALEPDIVLFTGDLVNSSPDELDRFESILSQLHAPDGLFSVLGNHDYCTYRHYDSTDGATRNCARLIERERKMGWQLLLNENRLVGRGADTIAIVGVENDGRPPFPSRADLQKAERGTEHADFKILLSHDPTHWRREVLPSTDIQLTLSGHTHAMQFKIGSFSPSKWTYSEWGGLYRQDDRVLNVSTGAGGTVPFRLGAWPRIDLITLRRK